MTWWVFLILSHGSKTWLTLYSTMLFLGVATSPLLPHGEYVIRDMSSFPPVNKWQRRKSTPIIHRDFSFLWRKAHYLYMIFLHHEFAAVIFNWCLPREVLMLIWMSSFLWCIVRSQDFQFFFSLILIVEHVDVPTALAFSTLMRTVKKLAELSFYSAVRSLWWYAQKKEERDRNKTSV